MKTNVEAYIGQEQEDPKKFLYPIFSVSFPCTKDWKRWQVTSCYSHNPERACANHSIWNIVVLHRLCRFSSNRSLTTNSNEKLGIVNHSSVCIILLLFFWLSWKAIITERKKKHTDYLNTTHQTCFFEYKYLKSRLFTKYLHKPEREKSGVWIQGDSGGKANIFGGDSIGHCEEKRTYVSHSEWEQDINCLNMQMLKHCEW